MVERVRTTISVDDDVLAIFKSIADTSGVSVGRFIGDWLADTSDGAQHVAAELARAREASRGAIRNIHAKLGVGDVIAMVANAEPSLQADQVQGAQRRVPGQPAGMVLPVAPSSNTGLKSPRSGKKVTGGNS